MSGPSKKGAAPFLQYAGGRLPINRCNCLAPVSTAQILNHSGLEQIRAVWRVVVNCRLERRRYEAPHVA